MMGRGEKRNTARARERRAPFVRMDVRVPGRAPERETRDRPRGAARARVWRLGSIARRARRARRASRRAGAAPAAAADGFDAMATLSARRAVDKNTRRDVTEARDGGADDRNDGGDVWSTSDTCSPHARIGRRGVAARVVGRSRASNRGPLRRRAVHGVAKHGVFAARASRVAKDGGTNLASGAEVLRQGDHELLGGHILHGAGRGRHGACAAKKGTPACGARP